MARKPRLEFAGARYHIISRGNYRKDVFEGQAAEAFEKALFEACGKCNWRLHAYVIMGNHYHLALETPEANLVEGMRWLQGTFGNRFNAFRKERGHVFQSRYKGLLIEEGHPMFGLVNYIHLNPVRAGMVALEKLQEYPWSSYPKFFAKNLRAPLVRSEFLSALDFPDSLRGMNEYATHLVVCEESDPQQHDALAAKYCRGWAVASREYRKDLKARFSELDKSGEEGGVGFEEIREEKWERVLAEGLKKEGKKPGEESTDPKAAEWKVRIAQSLRSETTATNAWIAEHLGIGHPSRVRNLIREREDEKLWDPSKR